MDRFDAIRAANPDLAISLYALTPGGSVTLEVLDATGGSWTWVGATGEDAMEMAFPSAPTCPNTGLPCVPGCDQKSCAGLHIPLDEWPVADEPEPVTVSSPAPSIFD